MAKSIVTNSSFLTSPIPQIISSKPTKLPIKLPTTPSSLQFQTPLCFHKPTCLLYFSVKPRAQILTMATGSVVQETIPPVLDSTSDPPPLFDGTTRLYISLTCPYAQRVWITRNCKGLQEKIKLVPIDLQNRPAWYKEKFYPANKVPALEHNNEVRGESLDLIKYLNDNFDGPSLFPDDPAKREFAEELFSYTDTFGRSVISSLKGETTNELYATFDYLEAALSKFEDGPFFLGQFSLVDIAYAPFMERFQPYLLEVKKYDITAGRPKLAAWIEEMNKIEGYTQTRRDPKELVEIYKKRFAVVYLYRCPYAQRVWIFRNYKGLQDKIKLVGVDLVNRPAWYKEKVYPANKVPALEHNNEIRGESIDLMKYIDSHFEGPALLPQSGPALLPEDPIKREFAEELLFYIDTFNSIVMAALKQNGNADSTFDHLETAISKFNDGPSFLGQFSLVDIAHVPFFQRYARLLLDVKNYDITIGRPKLTLWLEEMEKVEAYTQTRVDHEEIIAILKMRLLQTS